MTNPMPEAVTGDLIRWALTILRTAGTSDAGVWTRELERVRLPSRGGAEVDVGRLSPSLRGFLRTLRGSSIAPELDPESIEPVLDRNVYDWDDAEEESPVEEPVRRVVVVVDCEAFGSRRLDREFRDAQVRALMEACSRVTGLDPAVDRGDGAMAVLPYEAHGDRLAHWIRLLAAGLARDYRARHTVVILRLHPTGRHELWDRERKLANLTAIRADFVAREGPGALLVLPEAVRSELTGPDGRALGIRDWQPVTPPGWSAVPGGSAVPAWAAHWRPTPAGTPPDQALRHIARAARQVAGEVTRLRIGYRTRVGPPTAVAVRTAVKRLADDLREAAHDVSDPALSSLLRSAFRQAALADQELSLVSTEGELDNAERAEHRLYVLMVRLCEAVGDDEAEPVHERPSGRPDQSLLHLRQPDLRVSAAGRSVHEGR